MSLKFAIAGVLCLLGVTSSFAMGDTVETESATSACHKSASPFMCTERWLAYDPWEQRYPIEVSISARDPGNPKYAMQEKLGVTFGGNIACERFSETFHQHRSSLGTARCGGHTKNWPDGSGSGFIYISLTTKPFPVNPDLDRPDWLDEGGGTAYEVRQRVARDVGNCEKMLAFVKAYEARCK